MECCPRKFTRTVRGCEAERVEWKPSEETHPVFQLLLVVSGRSASSWAVGRRGRQRRLCFHFHSSFHFIYQQQIRNETQYCQMTALAGGGGGSSEGCHLEVTRRLILSEPASLFLDPGRACSARLSAARRTAEPITQVVGHFGWARSSAPSSWSSWSCC